GGGWGRGGGGGGRGVGVVGDGGGGGKISNPQFQFFGAAGGGAPSRPTSRYDVMVGGLGGRGALIPKPADLGPALERALASDEVWCINVVLDPAAYRPTGQVSMAI